MPEIFTDDEQAIDAQDIRMLLLKCSNRRLKAYLLVLASGGMRTVEALAIRIRDIDFTVRPTKIHIRAGFSKTRRARDIYISNQATQTLRERINWKYKNGKTQTPDDLVFQDYTREKNKEPDPRSLYYDIAEEFSKLLELAGFVERKDSRSKRPRHKITLHSIRRFVKTAMSEVASTDFSEWFLGHKKSSYWTVKEPVKSEIYATKCMKYLTFLDYTFLEARGKSTEAELEQSQKEIQQLRDQMAKMEESQLKITELLEVMKIAKSSDGKVGKDRTMLDKERRVTIGYVDDNNQRVEMKVPVDGFEIDEGH